MKQKLIDVVESLRAEIENLDTTDSASKQKLEKLISEIENKLASPDDESHHKTLTESLKDNVTHFEVSHPAITGILNDLMVKLSNMGI